MPLFESWSYTFWVRESDARVIRGPFKKVRQISKNIRTSPVNAAMSVKKKVAVSIEFLRGLVEQSRTSQGPAVQSSHGDQKEAKKMKAEVMQEIEYRTGKTTFLRTDTGHWFKVATWPHRHDMELEQVTGKQSPYETKAYASRVRGDERPDRWGREVDSRVSYCKAVALKVHDGVVGSIQRYGRIK